MLRKIEISNNIKLLQIILLFGLNVGCKQSQKQIRCLDDLITRSNAQADYLEIKRGIADSIQGWEKQGLKYMQSYSRDKFEWQVDDFIFNSKKDKVFGWVLRIDRDSNIESLDFVDFFCGEKLNNQWVFYIHHMPSIWFDRHKNSNKPYTFKNLSYEAKQSVIEGGLFKRLSCEINDEYIDNWIDRDGRDFKTWHNKFLNKED